MARKPLMYKSKRYTSKDVDILFTESMIRFLRLTDNQRWTKEIYKGLQKGIVVLQNEVKNQIMGMRAVYSGFMRSNIIGWIEPTYDPYGNINAYVGTKAWYDILVHEGLGPHSMGDKRIPEKYKPTAAQKAVAPSWKEKLQTAGKPKSGGAGPRPFLVDALYKSDVKILDEVSQGIVKGYRAVIGHSLGIPKHSLDEVLSSIRVS